jgi:hypothetical protein
MGLKSAPSKLLSGVSPGSGIQEFRTSQIISCNQALLINSGPVAAPESGREADWGFCDYATLAWTRWLTLFITYDLAPLRVKPFRLQELGRDFRCVGALLAWRR